MPDTPPTKHTVYAMEKGKYPAEAHNPFSDSAAQSVRSDSYRSQLSNNARPSPKRRFESYRLRGEYEKPWEHDKRLKRTRIGNYIIWGFIALGLVVSAYINFQAVKKAPGRQVN